MKIKITALLLAFLFILASCADEVENISSEIEESESSEASVAFAPENKTLVSVGKSYKSHSEPHASYPDYEGKQLTDGHKTPDSSVDFTDFRMVGYNRNGQFIIDLGEDGKRLYEFSARSLEVTSAGIGLAFKVSFSGSDNSKDWQVLGSAKFVATGEKNVNTATLTLDAPVDYRYILVRVSRAINTAFFFTDEIEIYADVPSTKTDSVLLAYQNAEAAKSEWSSLSTGNSVRYERAYNIAESKKYEYANCEFDKRAPAQGEYRQDDLRTFLTNGTPTGKSYGDNVWVGLSAKDGKTPMVIVNLGNSYDNVFGFRVNALGDSPDVEYPDYVDYYGSENGKDYFLLGRVYAPVSGCHFDYPLYMKEFLKLKYVRIQFGGNGPFWVEEIEVLAGYGDDYCGEIYPPLDFPKVTEELLWDKSESDYGKRQNLLLGLDHQISASFYASASKYTDARVLRSIDTDCLTDGKRASSLDSIDNGEWFFAPNCHGEINIFYDLGKLSSIDTIVFDYMERAEWGINSPDNCDIYLSEDGESWYKVGDHDVSKTTHQTGSFLEYECKLDKAYAARFIRFRLECNGWTLIDELSVYGKKAVTQSTARLETLGVNSVKFYTNKESAEYATTENNPIKANNINLIYLSQADEQKRGEDFLLPMVAYLDENGNVKDTFLDGFLYLPRHPLPSGIAPHKETLKSDWEWLFETTFHGVEGFDRLNELVGEVKQTLNRPDYKVQVYATILTVLETQTDFGDVDGDGVSENCYYEADRDKVVRWFVSKCLDEFEKGNYEHLEFGGFYWMHEEVVISEQGEQILAQTADIVHDMGSYFIWIPYYCAPRYYIGNDLGFDLVNMQANMVFDLNTPAWRMDSAATLAKLRGMSVEMEHTWQATYDSRYAKRYLEYLNKGYEYGYHEAINIFYDDGGNFSTMGFSKDTLCRIQYDATYHYTKGDLKVCPDVMETVKAETGKNTVLYSELTNEAPYAEFSVASLPEHGTVSVSDDGSFAYYPDKDYTGTDRFTYTYNNLLGESEECVVEITVK